MSACQKHRDLFGKIASFSALLIAARKAVKGKRKKPGAASFFANLERELLRLERELRGGTYRPGRYVEILVHDPKERLVSAAPFRDRVVHHALCAVVCPIFEAGRFAPVPGMRCAGIAWQALGYGIDRADGR